VKREVIQGTTNARPVRLAPDGTAALFRDGEGNLTVRAVPSFKELPGHRLRITNAVDYALSAGGKRLAWNAGGSMVHVWDFDLQEALAPIDAGSELRNLINSDNRIRFSDAGDVLATVMTNHAVKVWKLGQSQPVLEIPSRFPEGTSSGISSCQFSHHADLLFLGYTDSNFDLWDLSTRTFVHVDANHNNYLIAVAFSPDDQMFFTSSYGPQIKSWDRTGREFPTGITSQLTGFWSLAVSPDGTRLAATGSDASVTIWDTTVGELLRVAKLSCDDDFARNLVWLPDQRTLAGWGRNSIRLWTAPPLAQIDLPAREEAKALVNPPPPPSKP
jgi:hypothetical protein